MGQGARKAQALMCVSVPASHEEVDDHVLQVFRLQHLGLVVLARIPHIHRQQVVVLVFSVCIHASARDVRV
jgi:hypothetical protein